jgi:hypothetical protein
MESDACRMVWRRLSGRFDELQGELVGLAVLAGVMALGYAGVALMGFAVSQSLTSVEMARVSARRSW